MPTIFAALSDPHRFAIVERLMREGETPASAISEALPISAPAVSRHLGVLRDAGLVNRRVNGQQRLYSVRPEAIARVSDWTQDYRGFWEASLDKIGRLLDEQDTGP